MGKLQAHQLHRIALRERIGKGFEGLAEARRWFIETSATKLIDIRPSAANLVIAGIRVLFGIRYECGEEDIEEDSNHQDFTRSRSWQVFRRKPTTGS